MNLGNKVNDPNTSQKTYSEIINEVVSKYGAPKIPPLLVNNVFILISRVKARYFNDFFSEQCTPIINNVVLPTLRFLTNKRIDHVSIENEVRNINPNKATGSDGISGQMLLSCDFM